jgi:hypothetical protein
MSPPAPTCLCNCGSFFCFGGARCHQSSESRRLSSSQISPSEESRDLGLRSDGYHNNAATPAIEPAVSMSSSPSLRRRRAMISDLRTLSYCSDGSGRVERF